MLENSNLLTNYQRLGIVLKQIRHSKQLHINDVAKALDYKNNSSYSRIENGERPEISVWKILKICKLFECNIVYLFILADIDFFEPNIKTWSEFINSLSFILDNSDEKTIHTLSDTQRLGIALKQIRKSKVLKTINVSNYLGFDSESTYSRMEQGSTENICVFTLLKICKLFDCNIVHLFALADIDIFETAIKTWPEYYISLVNFPQEKVTRYLEFSSIFSSPNHKTK